MPFTDRPFGVEYEAYPPENRRLAVVRNPDVKRELVAGWLGRQGVPVLNDAERERLQKSGRTPSAQTWTLTSDQSLEAEAGGFELVSPILQGTAGLDHAQNTALVMGSNGFSNRTQSSLRTGLHVHHDARDLDLGAWKRLMANMFYVEDCLDELVTPDRRFSRNPAIRSVRGLYDTDEDMPGAETFDSLNRASTLSDLSSRIYTGYDIEFKNLKFNVEAFWKHGTAEFRHKEMTFEPEGVKHWVRLTQALVEYSREHEVLLTPSGTCTDFAAGRREIMRASDEDKARLLDRVISLAGPETRAFYAAQLAAQPRRSILLPEEMTARAQPQPATPVSAVAAPALPGPAP
jgi:hypothetical protein